MWPKATYGFIVKLSDLVKTGLEAEGPVQSWLISQLVLRTSCSKSLAEGQTIVYIYFGSQSGPSDLIALESCWPSASMTSYDRQMGPKDPFDSKSQIGPSDRFDDRLYLFWVAIRSFGPDCSRVMLAFGQHDELWSSNGSEGPIWL